MESVDFNSWLPLRDALPDGERYHYEPPHPAVKPFPAKWFIAAVIVSTLALTWSVGAVLDSMARREAFDWRASGPYREPTGAYRADHYTAARCPECGRFVPQGLERCERHEVSE